MGSEKSGGAYIYQGNSLIVPGDTPDFRIQEEVSVELMDAAFTGVLEYTDNFVVPPLEGKEGFRFVTLGEGALPPGWKAVPLRQALSLIAGEGMAGCEGLMGRILRSYHISIWRRESRFCGSCGASNRASDTGELARQCPSCGRVEYPRISPAVIVIITNDSGEVLLAHNKKFAAGVYSLIAGFNEAGESLEATVVREIKEEVNVDVTGISYVRSQPWPFPNSLMIGFAARYNGGEIRADGIEIEDARWFTKDNLPALPGSGSVSRYLIDLWLEGKMN